MFEDFKITRHEHAYIIRKVSNIAIRTSYYIFCMKDKPWSNPKLIKEYLELTITYWQPSK